jgi:hypothetical protein
MNTDVETKNKPGKPKGLVRYDHNPFLSKNEPFSLTQKDKYILINKESFELIFSLSNSAMMVYSLILRYVLQANKNTNMYYLTFKDDEIKKHIKTSKSFYKASKELIEKQVIARHVTEGCYWINTNYFRWAKL